MKKIWMLGFLVFAILLVAGLSEEVNAATPTAAMANWSTGTKISGSANFSCRTANDLSGLARNVTFFYYASDSAVKYNLTRADNRSGPANRTGWDRAFDTTALTDGDYWVACRIHNKSTGNKFGNVLATSSYVQVVIDNSVLQLAYSSTASGYNTTTKCPVANPLYINTNQSGQEQIDTSVLYFLRKGERSVDYTHSFGLTEGTAAKNYTNPSNYTINTLSILPNDDYEWWITYEDTDGTPYNTTRQETKIQCISGAIPPEVIEKETGAVASKTWIIIIIGVAIFYFWFIK